MTGEEDPRVAYARECVAYFDGGNWAQQGGLTASMCARMADAVRGLLEIIDDNAPGDPGVKPS